MAEALAAPKGDVLPGVQLLRGASALLVVAGHANLIIAHSEYLGHSPSRVFFHQAALFGVSIFFIISGFIIARVSLAADLSPRLTRTDFARRRFIRIVPFLWVCVIGYNLLSFASTHVVEWLPMLRALVLWPVGELKPNVVWSLRHELLFYTLFALLMMGGRRSVLLLVAWFLAPILCWPIVIASGGKLLAATDPWSELFQVVLLGAWGGANLQFGVGFLFGCLSVTGHRLMSVRVRGLWPALLATVAAAAAADLLALPIGIERSVIWTLIASVPAWLGIVAVAQRGWLHRLGMWLGDSSFALYLVHNPVLLILFAIGRKTHLLAHPLFLPGAVAAAAVAGYVAHRLVERPLIAALAHGRPVAPWLRLRRSAPPSADGSA
jgi:exopolysaccharide production protein ExoZ